LYVYSTDDYLMFLKKAYGQVDLLDLDPVFGPSLVRGSG
jgi:hypothetical protein